ncbi:MAG: AMP-binding protein [Actinomycetia bacterium]|nr:AMP-binding protein [Actinomycetes bacterium]
MEAILPIERWTLVDMVRAQAQRQGDRVFVEFLEGGSLTFAGLHDQSDRFATALAELGVEPGDRVLALATNSAEFLVAMIATHKRQAVFTPINTELKGAFLEHQVRNSEPRVVIVDAGLAPLFDQVNTDGVGVEHTIVIEDGPDLPDPLPAALASTTMRTWAEAVEGVSTQPAAVLSADPTDVCTIMYTSGTTGPSKGVLMPQGHCTLFAVGAARATSLTEDDHYFVCMPFFHANGLFMQIWAALVAGASATASKRFSVSNWLEDVIACEATVTNALGVMPEFIFRSPADPRDRSTKLTRVMAVPVAEEWGAGFEERFDVRLVQGFGMTEVNMIAYSDPTDPVLPGCAGRVYDDFFEVVIGDPETDAALPPESIGEILVRPKVPFFFNVGYYKMDDKTVEAWRNLWFHTGDAGRMDAEGRLWFVDRLKDRIRRRGENISSYEIEQVVNEHPAVVESAALGVKVEGAGGEEEVKLCVVVDGEVDPVELLDYCAPRMPRYAVPRFVEMVGELDKTPSGKVRKQAMRDLGITDTTWDRESVGYVVPR